MCDKVLMVPRIQWGSKDALISSTWGLSKERGCDAASQPSTSGQLLFQLTRSYQQGTCRDRRRGHNQQVFLEAAPREVSV